MPTPWNHAEGNTVAGAKGEPEADPAQSETLRMRQGSLFGNREIPQAPASDGGAGRPEKATSRTSGMHARGKSDGCIVPVKPPNKAETEVCAAEGVEGRRPTEGNVQGNAAHRTQSRASASIGLLGVREAARRDRRARFTALLHHVGVDLLRASFLALKRRAAPGVDGVTWAEYGDGLEERLRGLHARVHRGSYRALPSKRTYIPKADGRQRALGIAALEDKIVQHAVVTVLNQIYEVDFKGFSYGFRPRRSAHHALDALWVGLMGKNVRWVLDADIQAFFDTIDHGWLLKFLEHRIADRRILRLIRKWLRAGVLEDGVWSRTATGTPQGAVISPLLANVYLHYVLDLWADEWRRKNASGDVIIVRYADDFVLGFQHRDEAERFLEELRERLSKFGLALQPDKTRLVEFGRTAASARRQRGLGKPETFEFLGFTHACGIKHRTRKFHVKRRTSKKRMRTKLRAVKATLMQRRHEPVADLAEWLGKVVRGYLNYHAIPGNMDCLSAFHRECRRHLLHALRRRGQRRPMTWKRFCRLVESWIPTPKILHPYPNVRFYAMHPK